MKVGIISLGCAKNLVDSEMILGLFLDSDFEVTATPEEADVIIVNTCGFIESSKTESINTILEMAKYHKPLVVTGCLVERYLDELKASLPEVDLFVPLRDYPKMKDLLNSLFKGNVIKTDLNPLNRLITTPRYTAYLRISDGCNNHCAYCAIPLIRGAFKSRPFAEIISEAKTLEEKGYKEIVVISQDTTRYGSDLDGDISIVTLLKELLKFDGFKFIRLLYLYPDEVSDDLIDLIGQEKRLTPYFDLPLQHASSKILKSMNRRGDKEFLLNLITKIRKKVPDAIIRTTMIVGFPGETKKDFKELLDFVKAIEFDHLGAFTYSREEDTPAYSFAKQIPEEIKTERLNELVELQQKISYKRNKKQIGKVMEGIIISKLQSPNTYVVRSGWNAPDGVDGNIILKSTKVLDIGDIVSFKITSAYVYDIAAEIIKGD